MSALWSIEDLMEATGGRPVGGVPDSVNGISIDTRTLQPGDAFFAISGDRFDGHDFVPDAMKAGAGLAVVSETKLVALGRLQLPLLLVADVLDALRGLGIAARKRVPTAKIIAITGSVGKTSTKEMLRCALSDAGSVHASPASFNNHWGVPLTLARMPTATDFGIFEIGMNHAGEIEPLTKMVRPDIALITAIAPAHIGSFKNMSEIARAKAEIFAGLGRKGVAMIPRDSRHFKRLLELAKERRVSEVKSFGKKRGADIRLIDAEFGPEGSKAHAEIMGERIEFRLAQAGEHVVMNALAVLGLAKLAGADLRRCAIALSTSRAGSGRGERLTVPVTGGMATIIDESYNANPASMAAALKVLASAQPKSRGRRIAVLGDMLELGGSSAKLHRALAADIEKNECDLVYLAGPEIAVLAEILKGRKLGGHFEDADQLASALMPALRHGDVVMLKASNGLRFSTIIEKMQAERPAPQAEVS